MKLSLTVSALALALGSFTSAAPAGNSQGTGSSNTRPSISSSPYNPSVPFPNPPARTRKCIVKADGGGADDSQNILDAFNKCNNGGHVVFAENSTYTIGTAMDWTFLKSIDIGALEHRRAKGREAN